MHLELTSQSAPRRARPAVIHPEGHLELIVTNGANSLISYVDKDLELYRWYVSGRYPRSRKDGGWIFLHRSVLERSLGRPLAKGEQVDHINRDTYDNRRENLRIASSQQNIANRRRLKPGLSRYKGVSYEGGKWSARIYAEGVKRRLGRFDTEEEAAYMYDQWALALYGEFANLNVL